MKMKVFFVILSALICSVSHEASASMDSFLTELQTLVEKVEKDGVEYTEKEWSRANDEFAALVEKFKKDKQNFTNDECSKVHDFIGRFKAAVMKSNFDSAKNSVTETYNSVAEATSGVYQQTKSFLKGIFSKKKKE